MVQSFRLMDYDLGTSNLDFSVLEFGVWSIRLRVRV